MTEEFGSKTVPVPEQLRNFVKRLVTVSSSDAINVLLEDKIMCDKFVSVICSRVTKEISQLCQTIPEATMLRKSSKDDLQEFSWKRFEAELKQKAPTFLNFLEAAVKNPKHDTNKRKTTQSVKPAMLSAGAKLISTYSQDMTALKKIFSIILKKGGLKKTAFNRLARLNDCLTYQATFDMLDKFGENFDEELLDWKETVEVFGEGTYVIASDNVDWEVSPRQMRSTHQTKSIHKTHAIAVQNRVDNSTMDNETPLGNMATTVLTDLIPSTMDNEKLESHLVTLIGHVWAKNLPELSWFADVLPKFIEHPYQSQMKKKSWAVFLGCFDVDQKQTDQVQEFIIELHKKYVPNANAEDPTVKPFKVPIFADYLGFERQKVAQAQLRDADTPTLRLQGCISTLSDFHAQAEWHKVIWHYLYDAKSSSDVGTLFHARQALNLRNVTKDPHNNFYAAEELLDTFTEAYLVSGAIFHFGMDNLDDKPVFNVYEGQDDQQSKLQYVETVIKDFIRKRILNPPLTLEKSVFKCGYCDKPYKLKKSLQEHEKNHRQALQSHDINSDKFQCRICGKEYVRETAFKLHIDRVHANEHADDQHDFVYNYTRTALALYCIRMNMEDAIKRGDGDRLMLCYIYIYTANKWAMINMLLDFWKL